MEIFDSNGHYLPVEQRTCARCKHVLVDVDELGAYYQIPVTDSRMPGLTFMDRVHSCYGAAHVDVCHKVRTRVRFKDGSEEVRYWNDSSSRTLLEAVLLAEYGRGGEDHDGAWQEHREAGWEE